MTIIVLEGHGGSVSIEIRDYENAAASDVSDANWLSSRISVTAGPFRGEFDAALTAQDLTYFRNGLAALLETLKGKAEFRSDEEWLSFDIDMQSLGTARVKGIAKANDGSESSLAFSFETDQSYLGKTKAAVDTAVGRFPELHR
jgi:hypothetical protein